jgi:hypothetical protein
MKSVKIKAGDSIGGVHPEPVLIEISGNVSMDTKPIKDLKEVEIYFNMEAEKLCSALLSSLPQGIIEPLVIKLLERRVSLYHGVMSKS